MASCTHVASPMLYAARRRITEVNSVQVPNNRLARAVTDISGLLIGNELELVISQTRVNMDMV